MCMGVCIEHDSADCIQVHGHAGKLVFGYVGPSKIPTVLMNGRAQ
jgi:hypothetical protein